MYLISRDNLPTANRNIYDIIIDKFNGNVAEFAKQVLNINNSTKINRLFRPDKRNGKYPVPSTDVLMAIREHFNMSVDSLLYDNTKTLHNAKETANTVNNINIVKGNNNNTSIK